MPLPVIGGLASAFGSVLGAGGRGMLAGFGLSRLFGKGKDEDDDKDRGFAGLTYSAAKLSAQFAGLSASAILASKALEGMGGTILNRRREMETLNTSIANSFAAIERQALRLGIKTAGEAQASTTGLANAFMDLREQSQPWESLGKRIWNLVGIGGIRLRQGFLGMFDSLVPGLESLVGRIERAMGLQQTDAKDFQSEARHFFRQYSRGQWGNPQNRTPGDDQR